MEKMEKMAENLFHHKKKEDDATVDAVSQTTYDGAGGYNQTTTEAVEETPDYLKEEKQDKKHEHLGELGAIAAGATALYEKHEAKKDPEHAHKHKIEEEIAAAVGVGAGGYAFHEHHEKEEAKKHNED